MTRIARSLAARIILAAAGGALVGLLTYLLAGFKGYQLFLAVGGITGIAIAALMQIYVRTVSLTEIRLTVPQLSELVFVVNNDAKQTAWQLFIQVSTRVSTQPLVQEEGFLREALDSLYELFGQIRDLLMKGQPTRAAQGKTVEYLALTMLNQELRPFLSKWHPRLTRFEQSGNGQEATWPQNSEFRGELESMRKRLLEFSLAFARLAGADDPQGLLGERAQVL
jgi:hypothetical protein